MPPGPPPQQPYYPQPYIPPKPAKKGMSGVAIAALITLGMCGLMVCAGGIYGAFNPAAKPVSVAGPPTAVAPVDTSPPSQSPSLAPVSPAPALPATSFEDGTYEVGRDVKAGTYTCVAGATWPGYWERTKNASGEFDAIIANGIVQKGSQAIVTIKAKEFFKVQSLDCKLR